MADKQAKMLDNTRAFCPESPFAALSYTVNMRVYKSFFLFGGSIVLGYGFLLEAVFTFVAIRLSGRAYKPPPNKRETKIVEIRIVVKKRQ